MGPLHRRILRSVWTTLAMAFVCAGCRQRANTGAAQPPTPVAPARDVAIAWRPPTIIDPRPSAETCRLFFTACSIQNGLLSRTGDSPMIVQTLETWQAPGGLPILYVEAVTGFTVGRRLGCYRLLFFDAHGSYCGGDEFCWPIVAHRLADRRLHLTERDYAGRLRHHDLAVPTAVALSTGDAHLEADGEVFTPLDRPTRDYEQFEAVFGEIDPDNDRGAMEAHRRLATFTAPNGSTFELVFMARGWNTGSSRHRTSRLVIFNAANQSVAVFLEDHEMDFDHVRATATGFEIPAEDSRRPAARIHYGEEATWVLSDPGALLVFAALPGKRQLTNASPWMRNHRR